MVYTKANVSPPSPIILSSFEKFKIYIIQYKMWSYQTVMQYHANFHMLISKHAKFWGIPIQNVGGVAKFYVNFLL
jgi:hypothetical protein